MSQLDSLRQVRKAIREQEYYCLNEQDDMVRRQQFSDDYRDTVNKRYKRQ